MVVAAENIEQTGEILHLKCFDLFLVRTIKYRGYSSWFVQTHRTYTRISFENKKERCHLKHLNQIDFMEQ